MAAPIGGLSNAKWRDDLAVQEINAEHADKRLANVLAEQEKKKRVGTTRWLTCTPGWRIGWSSGIEGIWGSCFGKLEGLMRQPRSIWGGYRIEALCIVKRCHQNTQKKNMSGPTTPTRTTTIPYSTRSSRRGYSLKMKSRLGSRASKSR